MHRRALVLAVMTALLLALSSSVSPAGALSCADHPDGSPAAIASGTERLSTGEKFFESYDGAVVGTVTEIHTVGEGEPDYGATTIHLDVVAVLGDESAAPQIEISSPDPGWLAGHPFATDVTYFIPILDEGPAGEPNYSFVCDPISVVDVGIAAELRRLASDAGIPFSTPDAAPAPASEEAGERDDAASAAPDSGSSSDTTFPATPIALVATGAVIASAIALRARVRSAAASS